MGFKRRFNPGLSGAIPALLLAPHLYRSRAFTANRSLVTTGPKQARTWKRFRRASPGCPVSTRLYNSYWMKPLRHSLRTDQRESGLGRCRLGIRECQPSARAGREDHAVPAETIERIIQTALSPPPAGRARWTTRLLGRKFNLTTRLTKCATGKADVTSGRGRNESSGRR